MDTSRVAFVHQGRIWLACSANKDCLLAHQARNLAFAHQGQGQTGYVE